MTQKIAVVLFNLGGPDSKESIEPFLMNFFLDKNIIRLPYPFRWALAKMISKRRSKREAGDSYHELGNRSPLLENSQQQATALDLVLNEKAAQGQTIFKSFVCMRYWHPMADEVIARIKEWGADRIIMLPLYPQYSTTTTRSSYQVFQKAAARAALNTPSNLICCYPLENGFIRASAENVRGVYERALRETGKRPRILFSAHGLPESIVTDGDPYQWQCEQSAALIARETRLGDDVDWSICYQSRVGPKKWLGPSTEDALKQAVEDGVPVVILPHAFTQEHVETLVEIEIEYRELAEKMGIVGFYRVPTVGTHPLFIAGLAEMVRERVDVGGLIAPHNQSGQGAVRLCPKDWRRCAMQDLDPVVSQGKSKASCCGCGGH